MKPNKFKRHSSSLLYCCC